MVNDYRTVMETATNERGFSNEGGTASFQYDLEFFRMIPVESDPPMQRDVRKVLNPLFTPTALAANAAEIDATVDELIDACLDHPPSTSSRSSRRCCLQRSSLPFLGQEKEQAGMPVSLIDTMLIRPDESAEATGQLIAWCEALLAVSAPRASPMTSQGWSLTSASRETG